MNGNEKCLSFVKVGGDTVANEQGLTKLELFASNNMAAILSALNPNTQNDYRKAADAAVVGAMALCEALTNLPKVKK
jgi:hypothetical protein